MTHELRLLLCRSLICWRCANCAGDGTWGWFDDGVGVGLEPGGPCGPVGRDCRRRRLNAGDRLYFTLACTNNSLKICDTLILSLAEASTNPFSQSTVTTDSVVWNSTWKIKLDVNTFSCQNHSHKINHTFWYNSLMITFLRVLITRLI